MDLLKINTNDWHVVRISISVFLENEFGKLDRWCDENLKDDFYIGFTIAKFKLEEDMILFSLKWT